MVHKLLIFRPSVPITISKTINFYEELYIIQNIRKFLQPFFFLNQSNMIVGFYHFFQNILFGDIGLDNNIIYIFAIRNFTRNT